MRSRKFYSLFHIHYDIIMTFAYGATHRQLSLDSHHVIPNLIANLPPSCLKCVALLSPGCLKVLKVVSRLSPGCPKVVVKLSQVVLECRLSSFLLVPNGL